MKTEVVMRRELFGHTIQQKSKSEFLCATDLERAGNAWRIVNGMGFFKMKDWLNLKSTKELIELIDKRYGKAMISGRGRGHKTWMHPYLFIDMALAISPVLKVEVYDWLYDHLLKYRNESGNSFKKMSGALYITASNKSEFPDIIKQVSSLIKIECGVSDWQAASEDQLKLRDRIQENISVLADILPRDDAVRIAIKKAKEQP